MSAALIDPSKEGDFERLPAFGIIGSAPLRHRD
jgi:hypothetical protein